MKPNSPWSCGQGRPGDQDIAEESDARGHLLELLGEAFRKVFPFQMRRFLLTVRALMFLYPQRFYFN